MQSLISPLSPVITLVSRVFLSLIFILAGVGKIGAYGATAGYMESQGVPGILLPLVIVLELVGGLFLLAGYQARIVAFLLGGFSFLSGVLFHLLPSFGLEGFAAQAEVTQFMKNLALAGGLGYVVAHGAGSLSVDERLEK